MTKLDKLRERIEQEPKNVRFEDLDKLLLAYGFAVRQPGHGGSHYFYSRGRVTITIPRRKRQMPPVYVRLVLEAIDQAEEEVKNE